MLLCLTSTMIISYDNLRTVYCTLYIAEFLNETARGFVSVSTAIGVAFHEKRAQNISNSSLYTLFLQESLRGEAVITPRGYHRAKEAV